MSAQTESLRMSDDTTQQPPVIIKSGGGGGGPNSIKVAFSGNGNVFDCPRQPNEWQFSTSSGLARIARLEILDGEKPLGPFRADSASELAVLQVSFGQQTLMINDMPLRDAQITAISMISPVRCKITRPGFERDQWLDSETEFPDTAPFILFTQGGRELANIQCESVHVTLTLHVN